MVTPTPRSGARAHSRRVVYHPIVRAASSRPAWSDHRPQIGSATAIESPERPVDPWSTGRDPWEPIDFTGFVSRFGTDGAQSSPISDFAGKYRSLGQTCQHQLKRELCSRRLRCRVMCQRVCLRQPRWEFDCQRRNSAFIDALATAHQDLHLCQRL